MLFVAFSTIFFSLVLTGIGMLFFRSKSNSELENPFIYTILAFFIIGIITMPISFFSNIDQSYFYFFLFLGLLGISFNLKHLKKIISKQEELYYFLLYILPLFFITSFFLGYESYPYSTDTDTYHANAVEWIKQYGTVTGLANLMDRFGVNTIWHFVAAVFDNGLWSKKIVWIMPSLSYFCAFSFYLYEINFNKQLWKKLYCLCIIFWTFVNILTWGFPSLHYDFFPLLVNSILVYKVLGYLIEKENESYLDISKYFILIILATESFILKPMGAISLIFSYIFIFGNLYTSKKIHNKAILYLTLVPIVSLLIWLTRNILLSGWPLYPTPVFPLDFRWSVSEALIREIYEGVVGWARYPHPNPTLSVHSPISYWLIPWLKNSVSSVRFILVGTLPFILGSLFWIANIEKMKNKRYLFIFLWCFSNIIFWFTTAPDIRFGDGFIICFFASALALHALTHQNNNVYMIVASKFGLFLSFAISFFILTIFLTLYTGKRGPVNILTIGWHFPGSIVEKEIKHNGSTILKVWTPINYKVCNELNEKKYCPSEKTFNPEVPNCGNSPLPCTSFFSEKLRLLSPPFISGGFYMQN